MEAGKELGPPLNKGMNFVLVAPFFGLNVFCQTLLADSYMPRKARGDYPPTPPRSVLRRDTEGPIEWP